MSSALQPIIDWAGDVFFENYETTTRYVGSQSIWTRGNQEKPHSYELVEQPFDVMVVTTAQRVKPSAILASVLVVLVFVTVATSIKSFFRR